MAELASIIRPTKTPGRTSGRSTPGAAHLPPPLSTGLSDLLMLLQSPQKPGSGRARRRTVCRPRRSGPDGDFRPSSRRRTPRTRTSDTSRRRRTPAAPTRRTVCRRRPSSSSNTSSGTATSGESSEADWRDSSSASDDDRIPSSKTTTLKAR
ncbi:hypothetical protein TTdoV_gp3 [Torque teno douroucouli virus]|uniref:Uncharacterized ORF3 protein n=1 Tax=Torque teno douroucouli virus (isolate At-TTV3) TaxID=766187 RepID=ORF3_TTVZ1|nr:hypothetical protein TTdoV_gp3 [Torque teno douroucouli virus]Q9DUB6.1 RecName: Full=Uncharacterized ORF3 protein [Torque teno douroucouli virus (isolate At-TTV3)]BAB19321.1 unnamed protein product [Torque teno douroucouli virus]